MHDILAAFSVATLPLALFNVLFVIKMRLRKYDDDTRELSEFRIGMLCACIAFLVANTLYLLWDFDLIQKHIQTNLSVISRVFVFASVVLFFRTLSLKMEPLWRDSAVIGSVLLIVLMFIYKVCT